MKKYLLYILIGFISSTSISSCTKDATTAELHLAQKMIEEKTWFLDYSQTGSITKNYVGKSAYFIIFLKNLTTQDSDGLNGTYSFEKINGKLQIHVQAKTINGNSVDYAYEIISIGANKVIFSYTLSGITTQLFYSSPK